MVLKKLELFFQQWTQIAEKSQDISFEARQNLRWLGLSLHIFGCIFLNNLSSRVSINPRKLFWECFSESDLHQYNLSLTSINELIQQHAIIFSDLGCDHWELLKGLEKISFSKNLLEYYLNAIWTSWHFTLNDSKKEFDDTTKDRTISPAVLCDLFELWNKSHQKKFVQKGIFYSPKAETIFLTKYVLDFYLKKTNTKTSALMTLENTRVLDPACGTGTFLIYFLEIIKNDICKNNQIKIENLPEIYGIDINPDAIFLTKFRILCFLSQLMNGMNEHEKLKSIISIIHDKFHFILGDFVIDRQRLNLPPINLILGNPPYIRHRDIANPNRKNPSNNIQYRENLRKKIMNIANPLLQLDNQVDYYIYFILHGLDALAPQGILGYIVSNSWMNVKFGYEVQEYLAKHYKILQIHDNINRSFASADINTVLMLIQNCRPHDHKTEFIRWNLSYEELLEEIHLNIQKHTQQSSDIKFQDTQITIQDSIHAHSLLIDQNDIRRFNPEQLPTNHYHGFNWANYFFYAPSFYFDLLRQLKGTVIFLKDIADIRRGITTNCNDFFILRKGGKGLYTNGYKKKYPLSPEVITPFLESPRQITTPLIDLNQLDTMLFYTDKSKESLQALRATETLKYIADGEIEEVKIKKGTGRGEVITGVHQLASFKERYKNDPDTWYCLKRSNARVNLVPAQIFIEKIFDTIVKIGFVLAPLLVNNTFYEIHLKPPYAGQERFVMGLLLGSITHLCLELHGRTNFGGGALDTATFDIEKIIIPNPSLLSDTQKQKIIALSEPLLYRPCIPFDKECLQQDRIAFDTEICQIIKSQFSPQELYASIHMIQSTRIQKSNTFQKRTKKSL